METFELSSYPHSERKEYFKWGTTNCQNLLLNNCPPLAFFILPSALSLQLFETTLQTLFLSFGPGCRPSSFLPFHSLSSNTVLNLLSDPSTLCCFFRLQNSSSCYGTLASKAFASSTKIPACGLPNRHHHHYSSNCTGRTITEEPIFYFSIRSQHPSTSNPQRRYFRMALGFWGDIGKALKVGTAPQWPQSPNAEQNLQNSGKEDMPYPRYVYPSFVDN